MLKYLSEENQKSVFLNNFINPFYQPIKLLGDHLKFSPDKDWLIYHINSILKSGKSGYSFTDPDEKAINMRAVRNAWYNESSLIHPSNIDERMEFPSWKIIQFYYSIFSSIVAIVRTFNNDTKGHDKILNSYSQLIRDNKLKKYFNAPINFYIEQDEELPKSIPGWRHPYAHSYTIGKYQDFLRETKVLNGIKTRVTFPHFFKRFRDWTTYEDGYIFFRLYGKTIKETLDRSMIAISSAFLAQMESLLMILYDYETLNFQYEIFSNNLEKYIGLRNTNLDTRFKTYNSFFNTNI